MTHKALSVLGDEGLVHDVVHLALLEGLFGFVTLPLIK
jgi:hypothetical protein